MRPEGRGGARETTRERQGRGGPSKGPKTRSSWWEPGTSGVFNCVVLAAQRAGSKQGEWRGGPRARGPQRGPGFGHQQRAWEAAGLSKQGGGPRLALFPAPTPGNALAAPPTQVHAGGPTASGSATPAGCPPGDRETPRQDSPVQLQPQACVIMGDSDAQARDQGSHHPLPGFGWCDCGSRDSGKSLLTFTGLLKDMIKATGERPQEEEHRARSGRVRSGGAPVPMELGCVTCPSPRGGCVHQPGSPQPPTVVVYGGVPLWAGSIINCFCLLSPLWGTWSGLKTPTSSPGSILLRIRPQLGARQEPTQSHPNRTTEAPRVLAGSLQGVSGAPCQEQGQRLHIHLLL